MGENMVKLHHVLAAPVERVFRAFLDGDALVKWLPPDGFTGKVYEMDVRVGGRYRMAFTNFSTGAEQAWGGEYTEITRNERLRYSETFENPNLASEMDTVVEFKAVSVGTELNIVQSGIPEAIPAEACYLGWQNSLRLLTMLVETAIRDE